MSARSSLESAVASIINKLPIDKQLVDAFMYAIPFGSTEDLVDLLDSISSSVRGVDDLAEALGPLPTDSTSDWQWDDDGDNSLDDAPFYWFGTGRFALGLQVRSTIDVGVLVEVSDERAVSETRNPAEILTFFGRNWGPILLGRPGTDMNPSHWSTEGRDRGVAPISFHSEGDVVVVSTRNGTPVRVLASEWMQAISRAGNFLADHVVIDDAALSVWRTREVPSSPADLIRAFVGVNDERVAEKICSLADVSTVSGMLTHGRELMAIARMKPTSFRDEDLLAVFERIQATRKIVPGQLEAFTIAARGELPFVRLNSRDDPLADGRALAAWLRKKLETQAQADPFAVLSAWHVPVWRVSLSTSEVDAIGFWGPQHGPGIILNTNGIHSSARGRRITTAHELCHLLIDRTPQSLPILEVFGGNVDPYMEARATAFAAEFLLPMSHAYDRFLTTDQSIHEVGLLVATIAEDYRVSRWVAGYQLAACIKHNKYKHPVQLVNGILRYLDSHNALGGAHRYLW